MTKKDFEAVAELLRLARLKYGDATCVDLIDDISQGVANLCDSSRDRFDRARFLCACQLANFEELYG